jgi:8-oxo-dGTP diphosphatase
MPSDATGEVLLQLRAPWVHQGGTWAAPGGAIDSHESPVEAALREAEEEAGIAAADVLVHDVLVSTDHADWRYLLVLATTVGPVRPFTNNAEASSVRWVAVERVAALDLHPGFAESWPTVSSAVRRLTGGIRHR